MKLILAIVNNDDSAVASSALTGAGFVVTRLSTTGSFLMVGNTTLLIGIDESKLNTALGIIEKICKSRKQIATAPSPISGTTGVYVPYPIEVMVGGAIIFVLDVEQFVKV